MSDDDVRVRRAASFGDVADVYARSRPGFPAEAVRWLVGSRRATVLELGAGTGKLTAELLRQGHDVIATEPAGPMAAQLVRQTSPRGVLRCVAEQVPVADSSIDVVVAAQAFHWFDHARALPEVARVLRPGGVLALLWNLRDDSVPWVRRLSAVIGSEDSDTVDDELASAVEESELFELLETQRFRHWQQVFRDSLLELVASRSYIATQPAQERTAILGKVGELYDEYGRGADGMLLPYVTRCYRTRLASTAKRRIDRPEPPIGDGLLIDFS